VATFATHFGLRERILSSRTAEEAMHALGLTPDQFRDIVRSCERVLLTESTSTIDLKRFLTTRLSGSPSGAAARIAWFDDRQMAGLRAAVLAALRARPESVLWK
jgi:hypothetical protein